MAEQVQLKDSERQPCEVWTRVMGYHRPVSSFNTGKKGEFYERKCFVESKCHLDEKAPRKIHFLGAGQRKGALDSVNFLCVTGKDLKANRHGLRVLQIEV